jgi:hypothetical protein
MEKKPVKATERFYRRGYSTPEKRYMNPDGTATSRVFKLREKDNGQLSVDVQSLTTPEKAVGDTSNYFLFDLSNQAVLSIGLESYHDELPDNDAHAFIWGMTMEDDIMPGQLARSSKRVHVAPFQENL